MRTMVISVSISRRRNKEDQVAISVAGSLHLLKMALLDVCGISDWVKEDTFSAQNASVDRVNHYNFAAREPELAVPVGVDVSGIFHYRSLSRVAS